MNSIYKMTESSSLIPLNTTTTIISTRNNLENDIIEISPSLDIQSQYKSSIDTNIDPSSIVSNPFFLTIKSSAYVQIR